MSRRIQHLEEYLLLHKYLRIWLEKATRLGFRMSRRSLHEGQLARETSDVLSFESRRILRIGIPKGTAWMGEDLIMPTEQEFHEDIPFRRHQQRKAWVYPVHTRQMPENDRFASGGDRCVQKSTHSPLLALAERRNRGQNEKRRKEAEQGGTKPVRGAEDGDQATIAIVVLSCNSRVSYGSGFLFLAHQDPQSITKNDRRGGEGGGDGDGDGDGDAESRIV
jgi:hypothetical protein